MARTAAETFDRPPVAASHARGRHRQVAGRRFAAVASGCRQLVDDAGDGLRRGAAGWRRLRESALTEAVDTAVTAPSTRVLMRRFWPYARPYRRWLWASLVFVVIGPPLDAAGIWLFKALVDDVLTPRNFEAFRTIAVLYLGYTVGSGLVGFGERYLSAWVGESFVTDLRVSLYRHVQSLSLDFFERRRLGDILSRLGADISAIETLVLSGVTRALGYVLAITVYAAAMFVLQWQLALVAVSVTPAFAVLARIFSKRLKEVSRRSRRLSGELTSVAEESLANASLVQAHNAQDREVARYRERSLASMRASMDAVRLRGIFAPITALIELFGLLLVIGYGAWRLSHDFMTLGDLLVFLAFFGQLYAPVKGLGRLANSLSSAVAGAERVSELLDLTPSVTSSPSVALCGTRGALSMSGVTFSYPGAARASLQEVSFHIEAGQSTAVVGPSGSGKTTIAKLLLRFYDPSCGRVLLDGHDIRSLDIGELRRLVSVVMQETLVFDGTLRENIMWGRPEASRRQFEAAVDAADVAGFAAEYPEGLDTRVGQRGRRLSGGQRQRLAIARAMLRDAPVLVLDEATTGLDPESAERVRAPLRRLMTGRTTVTITHNLALARDCDQILVVERGRLTQAGTHEQLLAAGGTYGRLLAVPQGPAPVVRQDGAAEGQHLGGLLIPQQPYSRPGPVLRRELGGPWWRATPWWQTEPVSVDGAELEEDGDRDGRRG